MNEPIPYEQFRTGLTFADVYYMIYGRKWKRRRGVLGYWRELKQRMYQEYLYQLSQSAETYVPTNDPIPD